MKMDEYHTQYYQKNKESILEKQHARYRRNRSSLIQKSIQYKKDNPEKSKVWYRNRDEKLRNSFLEMYGGRCVCCGETEPTFLTIDHVQGQVGVFKKEASSTAMRKAIKNYDPTHYRILCMNCNSAVRFGRTCPHQIK
jgi:hypothetical protein